MNEPDDSTAPSEPKASYTIDELAAATGIPSRTIRFYQSSGALPKPEKRGRVAYYNADHIERLALIGKLQDRGLRMRAIKDLVQRFDGGDLHVDEWLGLEQQLRSPWVEDAPTVVDVAGLDKLLGARRPGFVADLVRGKVLIPQAEGHYLVPSPGLLTMAVRLEEQGVDADTSKRAREILEKHLGRAATELAGAFFEQLTQESDSLTEASAKVESLKPVAHESVRLIFAREMERVLRKMLESGSATRAAEKAAKKSGGRRKRRR